VHRRAVAVDRYSQPDRGHERARVPSADPTEVLAAYGVSGAELLVAHEVAVQAADSVNTFARLCPSGQVACERLSK
jgi:hypothetical protein